MQDVESTEQSAATPPEASEEVRISRKREREVSLEPGTPQAASIDVETGHPDTKDRRTPAKKNRVSAQLDATEEEEEGGDNALGLVPEVSGSPRTENKIRQISQGVEDITWQNMAKGASPAPEKEDDQQEDMDTEHDQHPQHDAQEDSLDVPILLRTENQLDDAEEDEHTGATDPAETPTSVLPEDPIPVHGNIASEPRDAPKELSPTSSAEESSSLSRRSSNESMDQDKTLKRKLADRSISDRKLPEDALIEKDDTKPAAPMKRPREEPDADENPRETKRPTPPPDEEKETDKECESPSAPPSATPSLAPSEAQSKVSTPTLTHDSLPATSGVSTPKLGGFMAYASTSSPFANVKGPSIFSSKPSPWGTASTSAVPMTISSPTPVLGSSAVPGSPPRELSLKRTGFEAFASSSSPFASAAKRPKSPTPTVFGNRSKSPVRHHSPARVNAFSVYATGGAHAFATPVPKRSGSGSPAPGESSGEAGPSALNPLSGSREKDAHVEGASEKGVSFGERLRASKDDDEESEEKKLNLTEQETYTGEEDEETVYQVRGKLFALSAQNQWKERGTGQLRLNVRREDGTGARLLMRKEAVYTVLLNATLFKGMKCFIAQDPRYIRFSVFEDGATTHYNLRVSNAKIAAELLEEINSHIPS